MGYGYDASSFFGKKGHDYSDHHRSSFALSRAATSPFGPGSKIVSSAQPCCWCQQANFCSLHAARAPSPISTYPSNPGARASLKWVVCLLMGWGQRTLTFRPDIAASQGCREGAATRRWEVMRPGQLHTKGQFVPGGECNCGFRVELSRGLDVEAVDSRLLSSLGATRAL